MKCLFAVRSGTFAGGEEEEGEEEKEEGWGLTWHQPPYLALYISLGYVTSTAQMKWRLMIFGEAAITGV